MNPPWNTLEEEFEYHVKLLEWVKAFEGLTRSKPKRLISMSDLVSFVAGMGINALAKGEVYKFFVTVFGESAERISEIINNEVKCFNARRFGESFIKICIALKEAGIDPQTVPLKNLIPMLEGISIEEEPTLQEWWTNLLGAAIEKGKIHPSYTSIMKDIDALDAKILELMFSENKTLEQVKQNAERIEVTSESEAIGVDRETLIERTQSDKDSVEISIGNLIRLNLCVEKHFSFEGELNPHPALDNRILLTSLGEAFVKEATRTQ